jgi:transcriptional regulator with GAF, ATPase, and Fis domain
MRAELQAYCGNEDAALSLLAAERGAGAAGSLVRARVAAARADWEAARHHAEAAIGEVGARAALLTARAHFALADEDAAWRTLDAVDASTPIDALTLRAMRARANSEHDTQALKSIASEAKSAGASALEAELWSELFERHRKRGDEEAARNAAVRAVELWDDMAMTLPPPLRSGFWSDSQRHAVRKASRRRTQAPTEPSSAEALRPLLASLRLLASERDPSKLLERITDGAVALSGAERGFVLLVDESGSLEPTTVRGAEEELGKQSAAFSRSIAETVLIDGDPVVTVDATHDARVQDYLSVHQLMLKSVACLPIETRGRTWGVLYLEHRSASGRFSGADLSALRAFADQAAIAIETARLLETTEAQKQSLEKANEALRNANAQLEERLQGREEALRETRREIARLQGSGERGERWGLVGASEGMRKVYAMLDRIARNDVPVVITGESGTGKELVARAIHSASTRASGPYLSLNCGAIPEGLLESELFGHVAGAFTGAASARDGVFVQADGGTLFMDELADMPARMQLDLLRVLQERRVRPVGGATERPVDVRLLCATKHGLRELVEQGTLREDLYYRLAVVEVQLPPLRERRGDIPLLCDHFLSRIAEERGEPRKRLSRAAQQRLAAYAFPGNVRELEHLLVGASVFAAGEVIQAEELAIEDFAVAIDAKTDLGSYGDYKDAERDRILSALNAHAWNRAQAARALGIPRRTFYRRLKQHGIELPSGKG